MLLRSGPYLAPDTRIGVPQLDSNGRDLVDASDAVFILAKLIPPVWQPPRANSREEPRLWIS